MIRGQLEFVVPLLPPSVNHYKAPKRGGGWFRTGEVIGFIEAVCIFSHKVLVPGDYYEVEITFYLPPAKQRLSSNDTDNFLKVALDALGTAGVIRNDGRVMDLIVHKRFCPTERDARTLYHITGKDTFTDENEVLPGRPLQIAAGSHSAEGSQTK
jgi:Holliday junction resolvase RusA-like endonuclease